MHFSSDAILLKSGKKRISLCLVFQSLRYFYYLDESEKILVIVLVEVGHFVVVKLISLWAMKAICDRTCQSLLSLSSSFLYTFLFLIFCLIAFFYYVHAIFFSIYFLYVFHSELLFFYRRESISMMIISLYILYMALFAECSFKVIFAGSALSSFSGGHFFLLIVHWYRENYRIYLK